MRDNSETCLIHRLPCAFVFSESFVEFYLFVAETLILVPLPCCANILGDLDQLFQNLCGGDYVTDRTLRPAQDLSNPLLIHATDHPAK